MREDTFTNTVEDAEMYERRRGRDDWIDDRPSEADEAETREETNQRRAREKREAAARARGEFVPTSSTLLWAYTLSIRLGRYGLYGIDVQAVREHVYRVDGVTSLEHEAWSKIGPEFEAKVNDGVVWVKYNDPTPTEPPF